MTNSQGRDRSDEEFAADLAPSTPSRDLRGHADESNPAAGDKASAICRYGG